ncbi:hypothetical protein BDF20DRAFT_835639 [Mycotypha africana]|uniref:uncharacterized protein n=1 Tax=Mycotypha africana TaxID=64632 RepID=UPI0022FFF67D|nr:uncharacterized protein BDF20DRAFT_835639 [Mycotypha africana]KAI8979649.1 hypothetical protein BDF20DRAFT_835639 [Mycotypha africana]
MADDKVWRSLNEELGNRWFSLSPPILRALQMILQLVISLRCFINHGDIVALTLAGTISNLCSLETPFGSLGILNFELHGLDVIFSNELTTCCRIFTISKQTAIIVGSSHSRQVYQRHLQMILNIRSESFGWPSYGQINFCTKFSILAKEIDHLQRYF